MTHLVFRLTLSRTLIACIAVLLLISPVAAFAQTPESQESPVVVEPTATQPPATEPPPTEAPATEPPPTEAPATEPPSTEPPTTEPETTPEPTEAVGSTKEPSTPDPTQEVIEPDQLAIDSDLVVSIAPGEYRDIVVRYTIGSDRINTEISAEIASPNGGSLASWELKPVDQIDLDQDANDSNRDIKARINLDTSTESGDESLTTWRVTAPAHLDNAVTVKISFESEIHRADGVTEGVKKVDLVTINASASVHNPVLNCSQVVSEGVSNTWNCSLDTDHPGNDVAVNATATVPDGWQLKIDNNVVSSGAQSITSDGDGMASFSFFAAYPEGCPEPGASASSEVSTSITYPSGATDTLRTNVTLHHQRTEPDVGITSLAFDELDLRESFTTTGQISVRYSNAPCDWQLKIDFTEFQNDTSTLHGASLSITSVDGLQPGNVTIFGSGITIFMPGNSNSSIDGEFVISLRVEFSGEITPGTYYIGVRTQFGWLDD